jgi:hypothetical protein
MTLAEGSQGLRGPVTMKGWVQVEGCESMRVGRRVHVRQAVSVMMAVMAGVSHGVAESQGIMRGALSTGSAICGIDIIH